MKTKLFVPLVMLLATTISSPALAQSRQENQNLDKINSIKELMTITGAENLTQQILNQSITSMKAQFPQVPQVFWNEFSAGVTADQLINRLMPIYDKYLTDEDIKQLIAFYRTPVGKKIISVSPQIASDSLNIGQQYGKEVAQRAIQKLQEQGYILK